MAETLFEEVNPNGNIQAVFESDGDVCQFYLFGAPDTQFGMKSVWVRNHTSAPETIEVERMQSCTPPPNPARTAATLRVGLHLLLTICGSSGCRRARMFQMPLQTLLVSARCPLDLREGGRGNGRCARAGRRFGNMSATCSGEEDKKANEALACKSKCARMPRSARVRLSICGSSQRHDTGFGSRRASPFSPGLLA